MNVDQRTRHVMQQLGGRGYAEVRPEVAILPTVSGGVP